MHKIANVLSPKIATILLVITMAGSIPWISAEESNQKQTLEQSLVDRWIKEAEALTQSENYYGALDAYDNALFEGLEAGILSDDALIGKAQVYHTIGKYQDAIVYYDLILTLNPDNSILKMKANALAQIGNWEEAIHWYQIALEENNI